MKAIVLNGGMDDVAAEKITEHLRALKLSVWWYMDSLHGGVDWEYELFLQLDKSQLIFVILSKQAIEAQAYLFKEITISSFLMKIKRPEAGLLIIPCRVDDCSVPPELKPYHQIDLFETNWNQKIIDTINNYKFLRKKKQELVYGEGKKNQKAFTHSSSELWNPELSKIEELITNSYLDQFTFDLLFRSIIHSKKFLVFIDESCSLFGMQGDRGFPSKEELRDSVVSFFYPDLIDRIESERSNILQAEGAKESSEGLENLLEERDERLDSIIVDTITYDSSSKNRVFELTKGEPGLAHKLLASTFQMLTKTSGLSEFSGGTVFINNSVSRIMDKALSSVFPYDQLIKRDISGYISDRLFLEGISSPNTYINEVVSINFFSDLTFLAPSKEYERRLQVVELRSELKRIFELPTLIIAQDFSDIAFQKIINSRKTHEPLFLVSSADTDVIKGLNIPFYHICLDFLEFSAGLLRAIDQKIPGFKSQTISSLNST